MEKKRLLQVSALGGALALAAAGCGSAAGGAVRPTKRKLDAVVVSGYGSVIANAKAHSTYVLDKNGRPLTCSGSCTAIWPPLLVPKGARIIKASGVKGKVTLRARGKGEQVLYNGWPLYTYRGDTGPRQSHGEDIRTFGGTWHLVRASAVSSKATPIMARSSASAGGGGGGGGGGW